MFKPLEAAQLPRTLDGVTGALVNGNFAVAAKWISPAPSSRNTGRKSEKYHRGTQ